MNRNRIIAAVEVGTSKVVVLVGEVAGQGQLQIIGKGVSSSRGVAKGEIVDFKAASDCVHAAILHAEQDAGDVPIEEVYLSQSGRHLSSFYNEAIVNVMSSDNVVRREDVARVIAEAKSKELPEHRLYIHHIRNPFRLDERVVNDPLGMEGEKLQVGYWCVTGERHKISDHVGIINGIGIQVGDMIISSLASGMMVALPEEKRHGVLVLDIGAGTTDYVVYHGGHVVGCGVIPVGGDHITNDLSLGLRVNRKDAERIKLDYGNAIVDKNPTQERVWSVGDKAIGDRPILVRSIQRIINARVKELFQIVLKRVGQDVRIGELAGGVVLTGGSSRLEGIEALASEVLGAEARRGSHPKWVGQDINHPEYSTVLGLFHYALTTNERDDNGQAQAKGLIRRLLKIRL